MLIVPAEHPLDWKKPPVITLLLILLNSLIYFAYQSHDDQRLAAAVSIYLEENLLSLERSLYMDSLESRKHTPPEVREYLKNLPRQELAANILFDLEFAHRLRSLPEYQEDADWQAGRQKAEAARDQISSLRFGFIPARFSLQGLFGSMFLHANFWHLAGNMVFLFVFGFALEIALDRWVYLGLYLLSGIGSGLLWWALDPAWISGIGASGAISGLMGMYAAVYGLRRIRFFYWLGPLLGYFNAPALWIFPLWLGKEILGLLQAQDNTNYYAHIGGLLAGFISVWLARRLDKLPLDQNYLHKVDPDAPFKTALKTLDEQIGGFHLEQATRKGLELLELFPGRTELLNRLYNLAKTRQDKALLSALLKQLFALPTTPEVNQLLCKLADDSQMPFLNHPAIHFHLLGKLLQLKESNRAMGCWRKLAEQPRRPEQLANLSLQLAKQLDRNNNRELTELVQFLCKNFPDNEATPQIVRYQQHLRLKH